MSKSDPNSAIFMEDPEAEVKTKIKKAFCPPGVVEGNPCLAYIQHIVLPWNRSLEVSRSEQNGGNKYGSSGVPGRDIESRRSVLSQRSGSHAPTYASLRKPARLILTPHPSTPRRTYDSFEDLKTDYESGALHPSDLKPALAKAINAILQVRATWSPYPATITTRRMPPSRTWGARCRLCLDTHACPIFHWYAARARSFRAERGGQGLVEGGAVLQDHPVTRKTGRPRSRTGEEP